MAGAHPACRYGACAEYSGVLLYTEYGVYFVHYCIVASIVPASIARFSTLSQPPSHGLRMYVKYEVGTLQPLKAKSHRMELPHTALYVTTE